MNANVDYTDFAKEAEVRAFLTEEMGSAGSAGNIRLLRLIARDYQRDKGISDFDARDAEFVAFLKSHDFGGLFGRF